MAASFRWSFHEVWQLLTFVEPEGGMQRGTIGQCVFMLLQEDPDVLQAVDRVIVATAGIDDMHPHRLRHTLATQAINREMRLEAIAALLGYRSR